MKQLAYSIAALVFLGGSIAYRNSHGTLEHDVKFLFEKDGCKVYSFKTFEGTQVKDHFFTSCKGAILDPETYNITELEVQNEKH
jgi:hypothetical protein